MLVFSVQSCLTGPVHNLSLSDKLKLTSSVNMNVVNISPNESIKYAKETQTAEVPAKSSPPLNDDDDDSLEHAERKEKNYQEDLRKSERLVNCCALRGIRG